jgi:hypothetical protein
VRLLVLGVFVAVLAALPLQATGATGQDVYRGTLRITVAYWEPKCPVSLNPNENRLRLQKKRTYRMPIVVVRNSRASADGVQERNPFNFAIFTSPPLREASVDVTSATVSNDPIAGFVLYEYWRSSLTGTKLTGRLARSHRESGIAANLFYTDRLMIPCRPQLGTRPTVPETIKEGARLAGTFTDRRVALTVTGQTLDRQRRFTARISASR